MKLTRLAVGTCCNHDFAVKAGQSVETRYLTSEELQRVVDVYNAVVDITEGSNNLPYLMTFQLLKETDIASPIA